MPGFALVWLLAAPSSWKRRLADLALAGGAMLAAAGWWVALVELWPASSRPYIGGSQDNSFLSVVFGYNGFGRLTGNETGSVVPGAAGRGPAGGMWGPTGLTRLFNDSFGGQIAWLLPAALILLVALLALTWRARRTDHLRASALIWGTWLVVTGLRHQPLPGDHPPVLHRRPRPGRGRPRRHRLGGAVAPAAQPDRRRRRCPPWWR